MPIFFFFLEKKAKRLHLEPNYLDLFHKSKSLANFIRYWRRPFRYCLLCEWRCSARTVEANISIVIYIFSRHTWWSTIYTIHSYTLLREDSQDIEEADLSLCSGLNVVSLGSIRCNAGSLWHKDGWLPCAERIYYNRTGSLWHKITGVAAPRNSPRHQV